MDMSLFYSDVSKTNPISYTDTNYLLDPHKGDITKHILLKFLFAHYLQKNDDVNIQQICSCKNLVDLFTKSLLTKAFEQLVHNIGFCHLKDDCLHEREK
ncbi:hypothetical protein CR513_21956, partial [Mucuna pruriens]